MKPITLFACFVAVACSAGADGIPVDRETGKLTAPYQEVRLNPDQIAEMQSLGTITFTEKQWRALLKKDPATPKRYTNILPITWSSCTCGMDDYCIALSRDRLAVLLPPQDDKRTEYQPYLEYETEVTVLMNEQRECFYNGHAVSVDALCRALAVKPDSSVAGKDRYFSIARPPMPSSKTDEIKKNIATLAKCAKEAGWKYYGSEEEEEVIGGRLTQ